MVKPANAQTIPKPSVPIINVQFVNNSYGVPSETTTSTNPYTGKQVVTTSEGYYIQNDTFVITLTGQPLANNAEANGQGLSLYFVLGSKGHYATQWQNLSAHYAGVQGFLLTYGNWQSKSVWLLNGDNATYQTDDGYLYSGFDGVVGGQYGGQVDFRACAVIGYTISIPETPNPFNLRNPYQTEFVIVQESDWSPTQTTTIIQTSTSPSTTPTVPEFPIITIPLLLSLLSVAIAVIIRVKKQRAEPNKDVNY